jgi:hypothetical protein
MLKEMTFTPNLMFHRYVSEYCVNTFLVEDSDEGSGSGSDESEEEEEEEEEEEQAGPQVEVKCPQCPKTFETENMLQIHASQAHKPETPKAPKKPLAAAIPAAKKVQFATANNAAASSSSTKSSLLRPMATPSKLTMKMELIETKFRELATSRQLRAPTEALPSFLEVIAQANDLESRDRLPQAIKFLNQAVDLRILKLNVIEDNKEKNDIRSDLMMILLGIFNF